MLLLSYRAEGIHPSGGGPPPAGSITWLGRGWSFTPRKHRPTSAALVGMHRPQTSEQLGLGTERAFCFVFMNLGVQNFLRSRDYAILTLPLLRSELTHIYSFFPRISSGTSKYSLFLSKRERSSASCAPLGNVQDDQLSTNNPTDGGWLLGTPEVLVLHHRGVKLLLQTPNTVHG